MKVHTFGRLRPEDEPLPFDPVATRFWFDEHPDYAESFHCEGRWGWDAVEFYCTAGVDDDG